MSVRRVVCVEFLRAAVAEARRVHRARGAGAESANAMHHRLVQHGDL